MLVTLGFLLAALLVLFVMPAYRRRIERFATERLKRSLPLTEAEITADRDRIRAGFATELHKLGAKLEEATIAAARQSVEINRRDARINDLRLEVAAQKSSVEENENARRVLEQAIMDRLPKVEQRLNEARRMLQQRDGEIAQLAETSGKQAEALEQATQINAQLTDEVARLKTALETRAARNRETIGDPRFDGEVALRSEIETLRAKTREQGQIIERLQGGTDGMGDDAGTAAAKSSEIDRLTAALAKAESELLAAKMGATGRSGEAERVKRLEEEARAAQTETAGLKAALKVHEDAAKGDGGEPKELLALRAQNSALESEIGEQRRQLERLKAEAAASNERLARQAQHFRDEIRRLSASSEGGLGDERRTRSIEAARRSLAARISEPRVPHLEATNDTSPAGELEAETEADVEIVVKEPRSGPYLKTVNGGTADDSAAPSAPGEPAASSGAPPRRTRLLDRISKLDKSN